MKITFAFDNGTSRLILQPETARDESYLSLCREGRPRVEIVASSDKSIALEFSKAPVDTMCDHCTKETGPSGTSVLCNTCYSKLCEEVVGISGNVVVEEGKCNCRIMSDDPRVGVFAHSPSCYWRVEGKR